jgi:hypothetical protein
MQVGGCDAVVLGRFGDGGKCLAVSDAPHGAGNGSVGTGFAGDGSGGGGSFYVLKCVTPDRARAAMQ